MSFLDKAKTMAEKAKAQASTLAEQHHDKIDAVIDKGGALVDQKTHGKYRDKIAKAGSAAKGAADRLAGQQDDGRTQAGTGHPDGATGSTGHQTPPSPGYQTPPPPPPRPATPGDTATP